MEGHFWWGTEHKGRNGKKPQSVSPVWPEQGVGEKQQRTLGKHQGQLASVLKSKMKVRAPAKSKGYHGAAEGRISQSSITGVLIWKLSETIWGKGD